ncbi:MAG: nuclear transport factor 2 family protein [Alphaproteobacteria bacterium]
MPSLKKSKSAPAKVVKKPAAKAAAKPAVKHQAKPAVKAVAKPAPKSSVVKSVGKSNVTALKLARLPQPSLAAQFSGVTSGAKLPPRLQAVIDQREIEQLLYANSRALDRGEEALLRSIYHPDATLDCGPGVFQGTVTDYVLWVTAVMQQVKASHHCVSNARIDVRGDEAFSESYFTAHNRLDKPTGREDLFLAGRYLDRFERRPGGPAGVWKIAHRKQVLDWVRTEAVADIFYHLNPDALWGQRGKTDMSYHMEQFPGGQGGGKMPTFVGRRYEGKSIKL